MAHTVLSDAGRTNFMGKLSLVQPAIQRFVSRQPDGFFALHLWMHFTLHQLGTAEKALMSMPCSQTEPGERSGNRPSGAI